MVFKKGYNPHNKIKVDENKMIELYYGRGMNFRQIADYFGLKSKSGIYDRFKKLGLKARHNEELKKGFQHSEESKEKIRKSLIKFKEGNIDNKGYLRVSKGLDNHNLEHRNVWIKYNGPIPKDYIIHHINEDKTDNRIENLQLMSRSEHIKLHYNLRRNNEQSL